MLLLDALTTAPFDQSGSAEAFLLARVLFGAILAFMGLNHFLQTDQMTEYAAYTGLPAPRVAVIVSGIVLVASGLGIVLGLAPVVAGVLLAGFLLISALLMHDFWAVDESDQQTEMTQFLKNVALAGGALVFVAFGFIDWPYALDIGVL